MLTSHVTCFKRMLFNHPPNGIDNSGKTVQTRPCLAPISNPQTRGKSEHTFPGTLEEEAHNKDLQRSHGNHHQRLDHTEVENPTLGTPNGTEVTVLTCAEVLLVAGDGGELRGELVDRLLQTGGLFGASTLTGGKLGALFVLDLYVTMAQLVFVHCFLESADMKRTAISKSTIFSAKVDISLLKQKVYSPTLWAVKTKSPWRSFVPSRTILPPGAVTE